MSKKIGVADINVRRMTLAHTMLLEGDIAINDIEITRLTNQKRQTQIELNRQKVILDRLNGVTEPQLRMLIAAEKHGTIPWEMRTNEGQLRCRDRLHALEYVEGSDSKISNDGKQFLATLRITHPELFEELEKRAEKKKNS